jgi:hypothetical protein
VGRSHAEASAASDSDQSIRVAWSVTTNVLFLESPARLDGVQIGRVRREVKQPDVFGRAGGLYFGVVVGTQIVHDQNVSFGEPGKESSREPSGEPVTIRGNELGGQLNPSTQADGTEQREVLAPVHGPMVNVLAALGQPDVAATHGEIQARFIEEDELLNRNFCNSPQEGFSPGYDGRA